MSLVNIIGHTARRNNKTPKPLAGKNIVFEGDSITQGASMDRWTTYFSIAMGNTETNLGISGQVMQDGVNPAVTNYPGIQYFDRRAHPADPKYPFDIPAKGVNDIYIFFALGTNDVGINNGVMTASAYKNAYRSALEYAFSLGWAYNEMVLLNTYPMRSDGLGYAQYASPTAYGVTTPRTVAGHELYVDAVGELAVEKGAKLIDIYNYLKAMGSARDVLMEPDGLHWLPLTGHHVIADYIISQMS